MADEKGPSPEITGASWGRLETAQGHFKDAKLFPGGAREWDWNETGTRHEPGVGPADLEELLERGVDAVVFGTGFHGRLRVREDTLEALEERGVTAHVLPTEEAVGAYNQLRETGAVGALMHSTC